jgi:hypothetical protein
MSDTQIDVVTFIYYCNIHVYILFFRIEKNHPGIFFIRDYASSDNISINIVKSGTMQPAQLHDVVFYFGIDENHHDYIIKDETPLLKLTIHLFCINLSDRLRTHFLVLTVRSNFLALIPLLLHASKHC